MNENIILVTIDSLRADHCGYIERADQQLTPTMDQLATDGVAYRQAVSPGPRTPSAVPPLTTGQFHQYRDFGDSGDWQQRRKRIGTHMSRHRSIAERLQQNGYSTAAYTTNPWTATDTNFDQGFDIFKQAATDDAIDFSENLPVDLVDRTLRKLDAEHLFGWNTKREWFSQWPNCYDQLQSLTAELDEPYFLWIFLLDCHQPYFTPRAFRAETTAAEMYYSVYRYWKNKGSDTDLPPHVHTMLKKSYRDTVRSVDAFLEKLVAETEHDDPRIVIHADHGEAHGEHGTYGHRKQLYDVNIHVPLIVYNVGKQTTVDEQISLRQLPTLIADLASADEWNPKQYTDDIVIATTEYAETVAVRGHGWKYIESATESESNSESEPELYNTRVDAAETDNIIAQHDDVATIFGQRANQFTTDLQHRNHLTDVIPSVVSMDEQNRERMKSNL